MTTGKRINIKSQLLLAFLHSGVAGSADPGSVDHMLTPFSQRPDDLMKSLNAGLSIGVIQRDEFMGLYGFII